MPAARRGALPFAGRFRTRSVSLLLPELQQSRKRHRSDDRSETRAALKGAGVYGGRIGPMGRKAGEGRGLRVADARWETASGGSRRPQSNLHVKGCAMNNPAQQSYQLYIGGEWIDASDGGTLDVFCPANGEKLSTIADATKDDVDRAVDAAWKALRAAMDLFEASMTEACEALSYECPNDRPKIDAYLETLKDLR